MLRRGAVSQLNSIVTFLGYLACLDEELEGKAVYLPTFKPLYFLPSRSNPDRSVPGLGLKEEVYC